MPATAFGAGMNATMATATTLPPFARVSIYAFHVGTAGEMTPLSGLEMNFGALSYVEPLPGGGAGYWAPPDYFAIETPVIGGPGTSAVQLYYVPGNNPNLARGRNGLGHKLTVAFFKQQPEAPAQPITGIDGLGGASVVALDALSRPGITVSPASVAGGWLRIYIRVYTGSPEVPGAEVFSNSDAPGPYMGTLTVTATI
jgi:hypothetical protein